MAALLEGLRVDPGDPWAWAAFAPSADRPWTLGLAAHLFRRAGFAAQDVTRYPEKKKRYDKVSEDEWTVGQKHCFAMSLAREGTA